MRTRSLLMFVFLRQGVSQWIVTPLGCHIHKFNASVTRQYFPGFRLIVAHRGFCSRTASPVGVERQLVQDLKSIRSPKSLIWSRDPSEWNTAPNHSRTHHHHPQLRNYMRLIGNQNQSRSFPLLRICHFLSNLTASLL